MNAGWAINMLGGAYADLSSATFVGRGTVRIHERLVEISTEGLQR